MVLFMVCSAVTVECFVRNPCWCVGGVMLFVMCGRSIFSSVLAMGDKSAMGLYDVPCVLSLLGFGIGIVFAVFHIVGMLFVLSDMLYMCVSSVIALGPRCLCCRVLWSCCFWSV